MGSQRKLVNENPNRKGPAVERGGAGGAVYMVCLTVFWAPLKSLIFILSLEDL